MRVILFILATCLSLQAQFQFIPLSVDYGTFQGQNGKTYTEVYISFYQADLTYDKEDSALVAHFRHSILIKQKDSTLYDFSRKYMNTLRDQDRRSKTSQFMDVFSFELDPGKYQLVAGIADDVSGKTGEYKLDLDIPNYSTESKISSIQLSTSISKAKVHNSFTNKNNLLIYPHPSATYSPLNPVLYFYFEAYNLLHEGNEECDYSYKYYISDPEGRRVKEFPEKHKSSKNHAIAEANGVNIITLGKGTYFLNVEFTDNNSGEKLFARKRLMLDKPDRSTSASKLAARLEGYEEYVNYKKSQLIDEFEKARYIATPEEQQIFNELDETGMKKFLAQFWKRRDPNKETPINEFKLKYFENLRITNEKFTTAFKEGWRTDRGRVLLIYGRPDEIERNPSSVGTQPYEIWYYYSLDGGSDFVFGDLTGHGNYELIHSTYRNEIKDPNWQLRLGKIRIRDFNVDVNQF